MAPSAPGAFPSLAVFSLPAPSDSDDEVDELAPHDDPAPAPVHFRPSTPRNKRKRRGSDASGASGGSSASGEARGDRDDSAAGGKKEGKVRKTRGSKACAGCRKIKAKCVGSATPPCERCRSSGQECIFTVSRRGKRAPKPALTLASGLGPTFERMEATFETAFQSLTDPEILASSGGAVHPHSSARASDVLPSQAQGALVAVGADQITPALGRDTDHGPKLHCLPDSSLTPLGLLAEASRQNTHYSMTLAAILESSETVGLADPDSRTLAPTRLGLANKAYFQPNPMNILPLRGLIFNQRVPSQIITTNLLSTEEIQELFDLYFAHLHPHYSVLCPDVHTASATSLRSPFLFSCICTVSSRFYTKRTDDLYRKCLKVTKSASADLLAKGYKSPEVVQGFLLLSHWNQPAETYEQELTYQFSGLAIRMACDLNLQRQTTVSLPEHVSKDAQARFNVEVMNRERAWLHCFVTDRSIATQMGKPGCIPKEDLIVRSAKRWSLKPGSQQSDVDVSAIVEMHRVVGRILSVFHSDPYDGSERPKNVDYPVLTEMFLGLLEQWHDEWVTPNTSIGSTLREFYYWYYRLFVLSFAVQNCLGDPDAAIDLPSYTIMSCECVTAVIATSQSLLEQNILRYGTDGTFTCLSYAAVWLLKLASPTFSHIIREARVFFQVTQVVNILEECAADPTHTPALYAAFIRALLDSRKDPSGGLSIPPSRMQTRAGTPSAEQTSESLSAMLNIQEPWTEGFWTGNGRAELDGPGGDDLDGFAVNSLVSNADFWQTMLMPGFGGPLVGLAGGNGMLFSSDPQQELCSLTPSRPASPHGLASFDFFAG